MDSPDTACYGRGPSDQPLALSGEACFPRGHIMSALPNCPACNSEYTSEDGIQYVCPEGARECPKYGSNETAAGESVVKDAHGNEQHDGHTVTVGKVLK